MRFLLAFMMMTQLFMITPISSTVSISNENISPSVFSPDGNGLNDSTTITFDSASGQTLYLNIFYNSTQLVRGDITLSESPSGTYRATWNGKNDNGSYVTKEGIYTIRVTDVLGGGGGVSVGTVTVDLTPPSSPMISINGGAIYTTSQIVNLTISAADATKMKISNYANFSGATWETFATSKSWQLLSGDGTKTVYINFRDQAGTNVSTSDSIVLDTTLNTPSLSINNGASATNNLTVELTISASDATYMKIDNNTQFQNMTSWIPKANTYEFTLPSGPDGTRTVYLRVKDDAGNIKTTSDSITVDRQPPTDLSLSINSGASYTNNQTVTLALSASGGPATIWLSNNGNTWTSYDYTTTLTWNLSAGDGLKTVYYKASDTAGNNATPISATITLDTVPPSQVTLTSPASGETLSSQTPTFSWSNPNQQSKTKQFKIEILQSGTVKQSSYTNASTTSYTADTLPEGSYSWRVTVYDLANNSATTNQQSFTISVDGLAIPAPMYPTNDAKVNDTTPRLRWSQVSGQGTIYYDYKYGTSVNNMSYTGSTTNLYVDTIEYNHDDTIYWAVRARNTTSQSNYSTVRSFSIDTEPPVLNNISINNDAVYTTSPVVTLSLNATGATWMKLSEHENFSGASWVSYTTSKSFTLSSGDGEKIVYFIAKDNAVGDQGSTAYANVNNSALSDTIILDTQPPVISNPLPGNGGSTTTKTNLPIQATLSDTGAGINTTRVTMKVDGSLVSPTVTATKVQYTLPSASIGTHTVNLTVYDLVGHVAYYNWSFEVTSGSESDSGNDGSSGGIAPGDYPPTITDISHKPTNITNTDQVTIFATVTDDIKVESVDLYWDDGILHSTEMTSETNSSKYQATIGPFEGGTMVSYYIVAVDSAPQMTTSSTYTFTVQDTVKPVITIISPKRNVTISDTTPTIKIMFSDTGGIDTEEISLMIDGVDVTADATITETSLMYTPKVPLAYGKHQVAISVSDVSGNIATITWEFTINLEEAGITQTLHLISAGESKNISFREYDSFVEEIIVTAASTLENVTFTVSTFTERPDEVSSPSGTLYMYLSVETNANEGDISSAIVTFKVEKTWLKTMDVEYENVLLLRYHDGEWQKLPTKMVNADETYVYYQATSPGFSTFAIIGIQKGGETIKEIPWMYLLIGLIGVIILTIFILIKTGYIYLEKDTSGEKQEKR